MAIGTFFSELGTELIKKLSGFDQDVSQISRHIIFSSDWSDHEFAKVTKILQKHNADIDSKRGNLEELKKFLIAKRQFLLSLLGNQNLLEHESFTNLLWAVFHLTDELAHRDNLANLSQEDSQHLCGDINRAYSRLTIQWLAYVKHLKHVYPYLFSLAMRTNPLDVNASVEL